MSAGNTCAWSVENPNSWLTIASVEGRGTRVTMDIGDVDPDPEKRKLDLAEPNAHDANAVWFRLAPV